VKGHVPEPATAVEAIVHLAERRQKTHLYLDLDILSLLTIIIAKSVLAILAGMESGNG
jgi:hypothetical protein